MILLTLSSCYRCQAIKKSLEANEMVFEELDALKKGLYFAQKFNIRSVPALIDGERVYRGDKEIMERIGMHVNG